MKNVIFSMLAFIVLVASSCQSENKDDKTYVDTVAAGSGLDSGERSMDTLTIDSTKITSSQERYPNQ